MAKPKVLTKRISGSVWRIHPQDDTLSDLRRQIEWIFEMGGTCIVLDRPSVRRPLAPSDAVRTPPTSLPGWHAHLVRHVRAWRNVFR